MIQVTNKGNAAAQQVKADAEVLGERFLSQVHTRIEPSASREFSFIKTFHSSQRGTFPLTVLVRFQDSTGYPFSALACTTFPIGVDKRNADLETTSDPLSLKDDGFVHFRIRNESSQSRLIRGTLVLPEEFFCDEPEALVSLPARANRTLSFPVRNLGAIYGASYPIFLIQQYEDNGMTYTMISNTLVGIEQSGNWFRRTRWYWAGGFVLASALYVVGAIRVRT